MTMITTTPRFSPYARMSRNPLRVFLARCGRLINRLIAAEIARRERQAARVVLSRLDGRELQDIGICHSDIADAVSAVAEARRQRSEHF